MTDATIVQDERPLTSAEDTCGGPLGAPRPALDLIELLFFSYRDFVGDADRRLAADGFGRAHHRVLHFVSRWPGLTVAELLELLRITKQSLNRVLKELLEKDYVTQREGPVDRRQRLLFPTTAGETLVNELAVLQSRRINRALSQCDAEARRHVVDFLGAMVDRGVMDRLMADRAGAGRASAQQDTEPRKDAS